MVHFIGLTSRHAASLGFVTMIVPCISDVGQGREREVDLAEHLLITEIEDDGSTALTGPYRCLLWRMSLGQTPSDPSGSPPVGGPRRAEEIGQHVH